MPVGAPDVAARSVALVRWLIVVWVMMGVLGLLTISMPGALAARNTIAADRAIFTAINTSTLTGFSQTFANPNEFSAMVQIGLFLQTLTATLLALIGGGVLMSRLLNLRHTDRQIAITGLVMIAVAGLMGIATWQSGESVVIAMARGISAIGGAGMTIAPLLGTENPLQTILVLPMGIIGAMGTVVVLEVCESLFQRSRVSAYSWMVLGMGSGTYLLGMLLLMPVFGEYSQTSFLRANELIATTLGLGATTQSIGQLPRGTDWILMGVAVMGIGTISTTGGLALAWLKTVPSGLVSKMLTWIGAEMVLILIGLILLLQSEPALPADRAVMLVVSSMMNIGLSHGAISITGSGLLILSGLMVVGRLLPLLVVMSWVTDANRKI